MSKPKHIQLTDDDRHAFQEAMRGVKPLKHTKISPPQTNPKPTRRRPTTEDKIATDIMRFEFSDHEHLSEVSGEDILEFSRPGPPHKMLRKLRQGQYNVEAILDLHGKTVLEAREALSGFLLQCQQHHCQHILIIHGKGRPSEKPILKNKLNHWLRQTEQVLAFCSATHKDGRGGALYVLLRR